MVISILGPVHVSGIAKDDIAAVGSAIYLEHRANIQRDVVSLGESVYRAPGVQVSGRVGGEIVPWNGKGSPGSHNWLSATWHYSGLSLAAGLALLLICICISVVLPWQTVMVAKYLYGDLARSLVAGLMGLFLFAFLVVPLGLSIFGLPFALLLAILGVAAWLLGLTAAAVVIGRYVARLRRHDAGLLWAVVSGMFVLAIAGAVPWLGLVVVGVAGVTGAGALALTMIARARPSPLFADMPPDTQDETFDASGAYIDMAPTSPQSRARTT